MKDNTKTSLKAIGLWVMTHLQTIRTILLLILLVMMIGLMGQMEVTEELIYNTYKMNLMCTVVLAIVYLMRIGK